MIQRELEMAFVLSYLINLSRQSVDGKDGIMIRLAEVLETSWKIRSRAPCDKLSGTTTFDVYGSCGDVAILTCCSSMVTPSCSLNAC